ncbi:MAG: hypothetical protein Q4B58_02555 [Bacteroidales bacterium]|nr:hypothetical protein [Bacteroidales bacterium]
MKKIYYSAIALATVATLTACDPCVDEKSWSGEVVSKETLEKGITLEQFAFNDETGEYTPASDGNFIKFATNPSKVVEIYYIVDGSEMTLSTAKANGMFELSPARGSNPTQTVYFRTKEFDGSSVTAQKDVTVKVATELAKEMAIICSNAGTKIWKWDANGGAFWGNFGYTPGDPNGFADNRDGQWWGITSTAEFADQQQHRGSDAVSGDDDTEAYMVFSELGKVTSFDRNGNEIRSAKFQITNYTPDNKHIFNDVAWSEGTLNIKGGGGILWPYAINTGGMQPEELEIVRLTANQLILTYAAPGTGSWSEATFWRFKSDSDQEGAIAGYDKTGANWTWDTSFGGPFWGNAGYHAGGSWENQNDGQWWGITNTAEFADQQQHRGGDKVTGDDDTNAYMTFTPDGQIKSFDASGKEIRSGKWSVGKGVTVNGQVRNVLNTSAGSILWPYAINTGGAMPEQFEIMYLSGTQMALQYAAEGTGDWSESTYWRFIKK